MRVARRYVIGGRVQGVGFRYFTEAAAVREGVAGWVRNLADGRVEVMLEGEQDAVDRVEARSPPRPAPARVEQVEVEDHIPTAWSTGFFIR